MSFEAMAWAAKQTAVSAAGKIVLMMQRKVIMIVQRA